MSEIDLIRENNKLREIIENLVEPEVGRWVDWTPTVTQGVAVTLTVDYARYMLLDQSVVTVVNLDITSAGTNGSAIVIGGVPTIIQPAETGLVDVIGNGIINTVAPVVNHHGALISVGVSDWRFVADGSSNYVGFNPAFALANTDKISFQASYER